MGMILPIFCEVTADLDKKGKILLEKLGVIGSLMTIIEKQEMLILANSLSIGGEENAEIVAYCLIIDRQNVFVFLVKVGKLLD